MRLRDRTLGLPPHDYYMILFPDTNTVHTSTVMVRVV
jgi:hypothetical protein